MNEEASQRMIKAIIGWAVGIVGTLAILGGIFWVPMRTLTYSFLLILGV